LGFPDKFHKKSGTYIGYVGNRSWRIAGNLWAPATGVVHGVLAYPPYDHPKGLNDFLLENNHGKFTDVTRQANLYLEEHTTGAAVADFDNNGWQDLLVVRRGDLIHKNESILFLNNGKTAFERVNNHHIVSEELGAIGLGAETMDYNKDGRMDVILGYERGKWHLFKNNLPGDEKTFALVVETGNAPSGKATALGALVTVEACGFKQVKRVGSTGAMYSQGFNRFVHFGMGECDDNIVVKVVWTNGETAEQSLDPGTRNILMGKR
jgi:hypothetical protein